MDRLRRTRDLCCQRVGHIKQLGVTALLLQDRQVAAAQLGDTFGDRRDIADTNCLQIVTQDSLNSLFPAIINIECLGNAAVVLEAGAFKPFLHAFVAFTQRCFLQGLE